MAIGSFGDVVFVASASKVLTLDEVQRAGTATYAEHAVINGKPLLEFTGTQAETFSFNIYFSTLFNMVPIDEVKKLREMRDQGKAELLVLDGEPQGSSGLWVITSMPEQWQHLDPDGSPHAIALSLTLKEYAEVRVS
jgi:Phage protein U